MIYPTKTFVNPKYIQDAEGNNVSVIVEIQGVVTNVPMDMDNTDWEQMSQQVAAGTLTIQDAD